MDKRGIALSLGLSAMLIVAGLLAWRTINGSPAAGVLDASGRIEGRITTITTKVAGRVVKIAADEGQTVAIGAPLAILDDEALRERVRAAGEGVAALAHQASGAQTRLEALREQVPLQIHQAEAALGEARARLDKSRAEFEQARRDADRFEELVRQDFVSPQAAEATKLKARTASSALVESEAALTGAERQLALAMLGQREIKAQASALDGLLSQVVQARAALAEQKSYLAELEVASPLKGTILTRNIEMGERVNPGTPLFTLVDLDRLYVKVYVAEAQIGRLALGQEARVRVDAYQDRHFRARVSKIAQQAEFTPKMVETREERVKLVFAVELSLDENSGGLLKPGMPADAVVRLVPDAPWPKP